MATPTAKRPKISRTHAARPPQKPIASGSSMLCDINDHVLVRASPGTPKAWHCAELQYYNLSELMDGDTQFENERGDSDQACCSYLLSFHAVSHVAKSRKLDGLEKLPPLLCRSPQLPDVQVFRDTSTLPVFVVEVHSGDYEYTINKCVISVIEQLRLYRSKDSRVDTYTGFVFPKLPTKAIDKKGNDVINDNRQCVVKVKVTWRDLKFFYELTCLTKEEVSRAVCDAIKSAPSVPKTSPSNTEFVVALSREDLDLFGVNATQKPSRSAIFVQGSDTWFKYPISTTELSTLLSMCILCQSLQHIVHYNLKRIAALPFMTYKSVPHGPLKLEEAQKCLRDLIQKLHAAITELHKFKWAHLDIRLENVCFDSEYRAVFIDLDRARVAGDEEGCYEDSCMYVGKPVLETDWVQLGWLAAWVACPGQSYHKRKFEDLDSQYREDTFLRELIINGKYKADALSNSALFASDFIGNSTVADVIVQRSPAVY